jgi:Na+-driven multidrug efflux pump
MLASAGQGYLRGIGDLRTPLLILVAAHAVNVVLELLFVYGFDWGLAGSAWGTVIAQAGMGRAFVAVQRRAGWQRPLPARCAADADRAEIAVRTTALLGSFLVASAVLARVGAASLAAHQIAFQLFVISWRSCSTALAVAAQVHGRADAGRRRRAGARAAARGYRLGGLVGAGVRASCCSQLGDGVPRAVHRRRKPWSRRAHEIWWLFAALMPCNGAVFRARRNPHRRRRHALS